jgi:hypothetical protein
VKRLLLILALLSPVAFTACATPVSVTTPAGKIAVQADRAVVAIGSFNDAIIEANRQKSLSDATAVSIVKTTRAIIVTLGQTPAGWRATVTIGWQQAIGFLTVAERAKFQPLIVAVDAALAAIGGEPAYVCSDDGFYWPCDSKARAIITPDGNTCDEIGNGVMACTLVYTYPIRTGVRIGG